MFTLLLWSATESSMNSRHKREDGGLRETARCLGRDANYTASFKLLTLRDSADL